MRTGEVAAPIVIGRDHLDAGSVASPNRETEAMRDGSDAIADWPLLNALVNTAAGATWVSIHHGGGTGIGYSQHAGMVVVADGTALAAQKLERVLTTDPAMGVLRHADAGYERAIEVADERGLRIPMREVGLAEPAGAALAASCDRPRNGTPTVRDRERASPAVVRGARRVGNYPPQARMPSAARRTPALWSRWLHETSGPSGIACSDRTGENSTNRNGNNPPIAPTQIVAWSPIVEASTPPMISPTGIVPQTMKRIVAFMRPCMRGGVIAWRRLTWLML